MALERALSMLTSALKIITHRGSPQVSPAAGASGPPSAILLMRPRRAGREFASPKPVVSIDALPFCFSQHETTGRFQRARGTANPFAWNCRLLNLLQPCPLAFLVAPDTNPVLIEGIVAQSSSPAAIIIRGFRSVIVSLLVQRFLAYQSVEGLTLGYPEAWANTVTQLHVNPAMAWPWIFMTPSSSFRTSTLLSQLP